jgi:glutamine amidotransferase
MAYSFNQDIPANNLFSAFRCRGKNNPDGWGIAFYADKAAVLFKEPCSAPESVLAEFLTTYPGLQRKLVIAHVRKASVGGKAYQNTHPFVRELNGREYVLAHNGTLRNYQSVLKLDRVMPLGINDTEFLLCYLLGRIEKKNISDWDTQAFEWMQRELRVINDYGALNCIFSDGTYLFAYYDKKGYNGLYYLMHKAPYGQTYFKDLSQSIDLSKVYPETAAGVVIVTRPLTDERWERFTPGQLMVFKSGVQIFPATPPICAGSPR